MTKVTGIAVVTGASSGIGAETAKLLAQEGAHVILLARREDQLMSVSKDIIDAGGYADIYPVDLGDFAESKKTADIVIANHGVPDIVVNCAGAGKWRFIDELPADYAYEAMKAPFFAAYSMAHAFLPHMMERNQGHIVNVNSPAAIMPFKGSTAYSSARWALKGLTKALQADVHNTNIKVSHVVLGKTNSNYFAANEGSVERIPKINFMIPDLSPTDAAHAIVKAIKKNSSETVAPFMLRSNFWIHAIAPRLVEWLATVTGYRRPTENQ